MYERVTIEVRRSVLRAAEEFAANEGVSVEEFIAGAVAEKIGGTKVAEFFVEKGLGADAERATGWLQGRPKAG